MSDDGGSIVFFFQLLVFLGSQFNGVHSKTLNKNIGNPLPSGVQLTVKGYSFEHSAAENKTITKLANTVAQIGPI